MNYLVFDVGGSAIKYALMSKTGQLLEKNKVATPLDSYESFDRVLQQIYVRYQERIVGVAFSLPGIIDTQQGKTMTGGSLSFNDNRSFVAGIESWCHVPISIENDAKCALLAEADQGSLIGCFNAVMIVLGTGIGGGILIDGKVYKGHRFAAGEFSFVLRDHQHQRGTPFHYWGFDGSARGLCHAVAKARNLSPDDVNGEAIFRWIREGDVTTKTTFEQYTYELAMQCYSLQAMFDPEKIAIGGGISADPMLMESLTAQIDELKTTLPITIGVPQVVRAEFMNDANLIGALMHHFRQYSIA